MSISMKLFIILFLATKLSFIPTIVLQMSVNKLSKINLTENVFLFTISHRK